jgi:hypothetical protein
MTHDHDLTNRANTPRFIKADDVIRGMAFKTDNDSDKASGYFKSLVYMIAEFEQELDHDHEIGVKLVSFGQTITFHVEAIGYWNPYLLRFFGKLDNGNPVELIQHVSQINFLLVAVNKKDPERPARRIGFELIKSLESSGDKGNDE